MLKDDDILNYRRWERRGYVMLREEKLIVVEFKWKWSIYYFILFGFRLDRVSVLWKLVWIDYFFEIW